MSTCLTASVSNNKNNIFPSPLHHTPCRGRPCTKPRERVVGMTTARHFHPRTSNISQSTHLYLHHSIFALNPRYQISAAPSIFIPHYQSYHWSRTRVLGLIHLYDRLTYLLHMCVCARCVLYGCPSSVGCRAPGYQSVFGACCEHSLSRLSLSLAFVEMLDCYCYRYMSVVIIKLPLRVH